MEYNKRTLIGNWYQEKLFPESGRTQSMTKSTRPLDNDITCYEDKGFQRTLPRLARHGKGISTSYLNDGINIKKSQMKMDYPFGEQDRLKSEMKKLTNKVSDSLEGTQKNPYHQHKANPKKYTMLNENNLYQLQVSRQVPMNKTDFKSTFRVDKNVPNVYQTTYGGSFCKGEKNSFRETMSLQKNREISAGAYNQFKNDSIGLITTLYCEQNRDDQDPKHNTSVQRSWLASQDLSVKHTGNTSASQFAFRPSQPDDIQTSTNINAGMHAIHPKEVEPGFYRHIKQDVTIQPHKTFSTK